MDMLDIILTAILGYLTFDEKLTKMNSNIIVYCLYTVIHFAGRNAFRCIDCKDDMPCLCKDLHIQSWGMFIETPCIWDLN